MFTLLMGTLIVLIPFANGVVVGADSRSSAPQSGTYCDGKNKILVPSRPSRTIVALTGASGGASVPAGTPPDDACKLLQRRNFVVADVIEFLEHQNRPLPEVSFGELIDVCIESARNFVSKLPDKELILMRFAGQKMFSVVLVSYDPNIRTTYIRNIDVLVSPELQLVGRLTHLANVPASDRGYAAFGTTTYAFAGEGLQFLSDETKKFIAERPYIRDLSQEQASRMAKDVIEAASLAEAAKPSTSFGAAIGGAVTLYVIDSEPKPRRLQ